MLLGQGPLELEPPSPLTRHWFHAYAPLGALSRKQDRTVNIVGDMTLPYSQDIQPFDGLMPTPYFITIPSPVSRQRMYI